MGAEEDEGRLLGVLGGLDVKDERDGFGLGGGGRRPDEAMLDRDVL